MIVAAPQPFDCRELFPQVKDHLIDWRRKMVLATGVGRMNFTGKQDEAVRIRMMERAAEVDAQRRLLELLLEMPVDGRSRLRDSAAQPNAVQGIVRNAVRCGARFFRDGTAEVVLGIPIGGILLKESETDAPAPAHLSDQAAGTGLIIDASGTGYRPALSPELAAPDGTIFYSRRTAARGWVHVYGVAGFQDSVDAARSDPRIGPRPVIVRGAPDGRLPQRLVLSAADADKLELIRQMPVPLRQGRVVIVTEQTKAQ